MTLKVVPSPVNILWSGEEFKSKCPLNRYVASRKGHWPIHWNGEEKARLQQISDNLIVITLDLEE